MNKDNLALAIEIRAEKEKEIKYADMGKPSPIKMKINFWDYYQKYVDVYDKKDDRVVLGSHNIFKTLIEERYPNLAQILKLDQIDKFMVQKFVDYLQEKSVGEGARIYFARFKKLIKSAVDGDILSKNPCDGIRSIVIWS